MGQPSIEPSPVAERPELPEPPPPCALPLPEPSFSSPIDDGWFLADELELKPRGREAASRVAPRPIAYVDDGWVLSPELEASLAPLGPPAPAKIDLNRAGFEALRELPGIGRLKARRILSFREAHGPLREVADLLGVKGIGAKTLAPLADLVEIGAR